LALVGIALCWTLAPGAQDPRNADSSNAKAADGVVRIGVPVLHNTSNRPVDRRLLRDWLVGAFEPSKKKKNKKQDAPKIEAVSLQSDARADALAEAREKNCDYVLFANLVEMREPGDPQRSRTPASVSVGRDPLGAYPDPSVMHDPVHYAVLEYQLQRLDERTPRLNLTVSGQEHADENNTVRPLLFRVVDRVIHEVRNPETRGPE
jgi:hypothetical protein